MSEPFCLVSCEDCKKLGRTCWKDKARNAAPTMLSALDECEKLIDLLMVMRKHINHLPKPYRFTPDQDKFIYETIKKVDGIRLAAIAKAKGGAVMTERKKTGAELIFDERLRQIGQEGFTAEHDAAHKNCELIDAAIAYAEETNFRFGGTDCSGEFFFPESWDKSWWKPSKDPIRNLVKAGALLAAEIDRRLAEESEAQS